jgi:hypothetical protein
LIGNGTYEIKPEQQVLFRQGKMQSVETPLAGCGCPAPQEPVMRAAADPTSVVPENKTGNNLALADSNSQPSITAGTGTDGGAPEKAAVPNAPPTPASNDDAQISAPLVFNAKELARMRAEAATPAVSEKVAAMPLARPADPLPPMVVLPPVPKPERKGFFGRIGHFFRSIF